MVIRIGRVLRLRFFWMTGLLHVEWFPAVSDRAKLKNQGSCWRAEGGNEEKHITTATHIVHIFILFIIIVIKLVHLDDRSNSKISNNHINKKSPCSKDLMHQMMSRHPPKSRHRYSVDSNHKSPISIRLSQTRSSMSYYPKSHRWFNTKLVLI